MKDYNKYVQKTEKYATIRKWLYIMAWATTVCALIGTFVDRVLTAIFLLITAIAIVMILAVSWYKDRIETKFWRVKKWSDPL